MLKNGQAFKIKRSFVLKNPFDKSSTTITSGQIAIVDTTPVVTLVKMNKDKYPMVMGTEYIERLIKKGSIHEVTT